MRVLDGKLQSGSLEGHKAYQYIPLVIHQAAGVYSIAQNPANEPITLAKTAAGRVQLTLTNASLSPLFCSGVANMASFATQAGLLLENAPTSSVVNLCVLVAGVPTDPTDIHVVLVKQVVG